MIRQGGKWLRWRPAMVSAMVAFLFAMGLRAVDAAPPRLVPVKVELPPEVEAAFERQDYQAAARVLRMLLEERPGDPGLTARLAEAYLNLGYFDEALSLADELADKGAGVRPVAAVLKARALLGLRRADAALTVLKEQRFPDELTLAAALTEGDAWLLKQNYLKAMAAYGRAEAAAPNAPEPKLALARLALARGDIPSAEESLAGARRLAPRDSRVLALEGELAKRRGDLEGALKKFDEALAANPNDLAARIERAGLLLALGRLDEGGREVEMIRSRLPDSPMSDYLEALYLVRLGKLDQARKHADAAARMLGDYVPLIRLRAWLSFLEGKTEEAIVLARRVVDRAPDDLVARELLAAALLRRASVKAAYEVLAPLERAGRLDVRGRILMASIYLRLGRYEPAVRLYEQAMKRYPQLDELKTQYALGRFALGAVDEAIARLGEVAANGTDAFRAAAMLALINRRAGRLDAAMRAAERVDELSPGAPFAPNLKGLIALSGGEPEKAREFFEQALQRDPDFLPARRNLALTLVRLGQDEEAAPLFEELIERDPKDGISLVSLAEIRAREGNHAAASRLLERAVALAPKKPRLQILLIDETRRAGDRKRAFAMARRADTLNPGVREIVERLAELAFETGDIERAERAWRRLVASFPDEPRYYVGLARAQWRLGRLDTARQTLLKADKLVKEPGHPVRRHILEILMQVEQSAGNRNAAIGYGRELLRLFPESAGVEGRLARLLAADGRKDEALELARAAHLHAPEDSDVERTFAFLLDDLGRKQEAMTHYERLIRRLPGDVLLTYRFARVLLDRQDPRALEMARRAWRMAPDSPDVALLLAEAEIRVDPQHARRLLEALAPDGLDDEQRRHRRELLAKLDAEPKEGAQ
ncbi:MAG: hypothetical protein D6757_11130 [Alphaproteobacteria bacterium]|nr:MAG: hypothetical protein D6757_11130 [Alphaproteobacteria bacterium]